MVNGETVAIKEIDLEGSDPAFAEDVSREITTLATCGAEHIVTYKGSFLHGTYLWMVMEYCAGGSIRSLLEYGGSLDENSTIYVAHTVLLALRYLHRSGIIHRDIKAANILITHNGQIKLGDFGVASLRIAHVKNSGIKNDCHLDKRKEFPIGSPYWMAPEIIKEEGFNEKADIWSLGITIIEMLTGNPPLYNIDPNKALAIISRSLPARLDGSLFSERMCRLVSLCLHDDPNRRPSAEELLKLSCFKRLGHSSGSPLNQQIKLMMSDCIKTGLQIQSSKMEPEVEAAKFSVNIEHKIHKDTSSPHVSHTKGRSSILMTLNTTVDNIQTISPINSIKTSLDQSPDISSPQCHAKLTKQSNLESIIESFESTNIVDEQKSDIFVILQSKRNDHDRVLRKSIGIMDISTKTINSKSNLNQIMIKLRLQAHQENIPKLSISSISPELKLAQLEKMHEYIKSTLELIDSSLTIILEWVKQ